MTTNTSNTTEETRFAEFLNSQPDLTNITIPAITLQPCTLYTLTATITNHYNYSSTQPIQVATLCKAPCINTCSDGNRAGYEECDDGNTVSGDGCSSICMIESNWICKTSSNATGKDVCGCSSDPGVHEYQGMCFKLDSSLEAIVNALGLSQSISSKVVEGVALGSQMFTGATDSFFPTAINYLRLQVLLRYCDVGYPLVVEEFFIKAASSSDSSKKSSESELIPDIVLSFTSDNTTYLSQIGRFKVFNKSVNFLSNVGSSLLLPLAFLLVIGVIRIVKYLTKSSKKTTALIEKLLVVFEWNMIISSVTGALVKLSLAFYLQLGEPKFDLLGTINFLVGLVVLLLTACFFVLAFFLVTWNWKIVKDELFLDKRTLEIASTAQKRFEIFWKSYRLNFAVGRYFYVIQSFRNFLVVTIVYTFQNSPTEQSYILLFASIIYMLILVISRPFKKTSEFVNVLLNEFFMMIEEVMMVVFSINKKLKFLGKSGGEMLGWVMIGSILAALVVNGVILLYTVIYGAYKALSKKKVKPAPLKLQKMRVKKRRRTNFSINESRARFHESEL